jgi:rhamnogalacturonan endolyase
LLWSLDKDLDDHDDGVAVVVLKEQTPPVFVCAASDEGFFLADMKGNILKHLFLGHVQNPGIADFRPDLPGLETATVNFWGNQGIIHFYDSSGNVYHGLFDGWGRSVVKLPADGHPDMCCAALDITGDCRDELVVWDPYELWVYTQEDNPKSGRLYKPHRSPLYNDSNYRAIVSTPGWSEN